MIFEKKNLVYYSNGHICLSRIYPETLLNQVTGFKWASFFDSPHTLHRLDFMKEDIIICIFVSEKWEFELRKWEETNFKGQYELLLF